MSVALITGASTGIGKALSIALAKKDWTVYAGVRKEFDAKTLYSESKNIIPLILDVTHHDQIETAFSKIDSENPAGLNALINNAGIAMGGPIEAVTLAEWKSVFDVNLFGVVDITQTMLPLIRACQGRIINISSVSGLMASPFMATYSASKFALEAFSDSLRREVGKLGVKVSVIEPGPVATEIWQKGLSSGATQAQNYSEEVQKTYGSAMKSFATMLQKTADEALSVDKVVKQVELALFSKSPKTRYIVSQKQTLFKVMQHLPDRLVDQAVFRLRR